MRSPRLILITLTLALLPTVIYWNTVFERYGFRDDYPTAREAREDPANIVRFVATQARPIYAALVIGSFREVDRIEDFRWIRLTSALLWGALSAGLFWTLRAARWNLIPAILVTAIFPLLPASQVIIAWAVAWPHVIAMLLALAGFVAAERGFSREQWTHRLAWAASAVLLVAFTTLTYQASTFFYLTVFTAAFIPRRGETIAQLLGWSVRHAVVLILGVIAAVAAMAIVFHFGWLEPSGRVGLESDPLGKLAWFIREPLNNALALIILNNEAGTPLAHRVAVITVLVLFAASAVCMIRRRGWRTGWIWIAALVLLPPAAYAAGMISAYRLNAYRISLPMAGVIVVLFAAALRDVAGRNLANVALALVLLVGAWKAHRQSYELFARPQIAELALVEEAADQVDPERGARVFIQPATLGDVAPPHRVADEFGSLTADGDWIVKEMLLLILHGRYGDAAPPIEIMGTPLPESPGPQDVLIDMRQLGTNFAP